MSSARPTLSHDVPRAIAQPLEAVRSVAPPRRTVFVDVLRLIASAQMVVGHTVDGLLAEELRDGAFYEGWRWARGLTSVAFMVAAGMSYHLSTLARFERHKSDPEAPRRRLRRGFVLIGIGYLLHLPFGALSADPAIALAAWHELAMVDVLQCIGVSLLLLEGLTLLARRPGQVVIACAGGAVFFFAVAPLADRVDPSGVLRPLLNYLTHRGGSLFPLFPWCGYVLAGVVAAYLVMAERAQALAWRTLLAALGATALAMTASASPWRLAEATTSYSAMPSVNAIKLATVLAIASVLAFATWRLERLPRALAILSRETLAIYVSHLFVLFSAGVGLVALLGPTLDLPSALAVALLMVFFSATVALGWHRLGRDAWVGLLRRTSWRR